MNVKVYPYTFSDAIIQIYTQVDSCSIYSVIAEINPDFMAAMNQNGTDVTILLESPDGSVFRKRKHSYQTADELKAVEVFKEWTRLVISDKMYVIPCGLKTSKELELLLDSKFLWED